LVFPDSFMSYSVFLLRLAQKQPHHFCSPSRQMDPSFIYSLLPPAFFFSPSRFNFVLLALKAPRSFRRNSRALHASPSSHESDTSFSLFFLWKRSFCGLYPPSPLREGRPPPSFLPAFSDEAYKSDFFLRDDPPREILEPPSNFFSFPLIPPGR